MKVDRKTFLCESTAFFHNLKFNMFLRIQGVFEGNFSCCTTCFYEEVNNAEVYWAAIIDELNLTKRVFAITGVGLNFYIVFPCNKVYITIAITKLKSLYYFWVNP